MTVSDQTVNCLNIIGWGGVVDINRTAERMRWVGRPRYTLAALWHILFRRRRRAVLVLDDQTADDEFLFVVGCNTQFTAKGMRLAPRADLGDGKIDVIVVRRASFGQLLRRIPPRLRWLARRLSTVSNTIRCGRFALSRKARTY